jgi:beta-barrel assembly-enhancing protease
VRYRFAGLLATLCLAGPSLAAEESVSYRPQDADERGLWMQMDEAERKLKTSNFVIRDPALNDYVRQVLCRMVGEPQCAEVRIYLLRTPHFNAEMAPNGMMLVYSGLLLRARDEAQLAAVLGHEFAHYRNQHSLKTFRDMKAKTNTMAWLAVVPGVNLAASGAILAMQMGLAGSIMAHSRENEAEADAHSIPLMVTGGYDPGAAARTWEQLRAEMDATAAGRNQKSRKNADRGMFASHPPTADRVTALSALARVRVPDNSPGDLNREAYRQALAPYWALFIEDQIKLNDFGGTEFLLQQLAADGWTGELLYARGELYRARGRPEDLKSAVAFFREATTSEGAVAEVWRGMGLALMRSGALDEGKVALRQYLALRPEASDKSMISRLAGE